MKPLALRCLHKPLFAALLLSGLVATAQAREAAKDDVLKLLQLTPSEQSRDYVSSKGQFQLHTLLTEQRHPQTMDLSRRIGRDTQAGLDALFAVDRDVAATMNAVADDPARLQSLQSAAQSMQDALRNGHRVYFYGTGSTGRLAETLESGLWRPFWQRVQTQPKIWRKVQAAYPDIQHRVRGEITGGDRALIASLEGFEDLQLIGRLQLQDNGIRKDDVVFAVTEGGETSAVIGTAKAGAELNGNDPSKTWFVYNNPDTVLLPFERSREVIEHAGIIKINLATGPQSITGSTRMQATTTSLYALGVAMEQAIGELLARVLSKKEMQTLGFDDKTDIAARLRDFSTLQSSVAAAAPVVAPWTNAEAGAYANGKHTTYLAKRTLMPVFVDVTERAPTFRLAALDRVDARERRSWIRVVTPAANASDAWDALLHRPFHGLDKALYAEPFDTQISDPWLHKAAQTSLANAGAEQQQLYDLSYTAVNLARAQPTSGDHAALLLMGDEIPDVMGKDALASFAAAGNSLAVVHVGIDALPATTLSRLRQQYPQAIVVDVDLPFENDPLQLNQTLALKMLLNAHSTGIMAKLGRVVGNTMTAVQPGNLKLYGRATFLIQSHVNAILASDKWKASHGAWAALDYAQANAVMFDAADWRRANAEQATSPEVELSIVRVLESLRQNRNVDWAAANALLQQRKLDDYLASYD